MDNTEWLNNLKPGDPVVILFRDNAYNSTVIRRTATQIICGNPMHGISAGWRFKARNGMEYGGGEYHKREIIDPQSSIAKSGLAFTRKRRLVTEIARRLDETPLPQLEQLWAIITTRGTSS